MSFKSLTCPTGILSRSGRRKGFILLPRAKVAEGRMRGYGHVEERPLVLALFHGVRGNA
jgi:hypothetical protein